MNKGITPPGSYLVKNIIESFDNKTLYVVLENAERQRYIRIVDRNNREIHIGKEVVVN